MKGEWAGIVDSLPVDLLRHLLAYVIPQETTLTYLRQAFRHQVALNMDCHECQSTLRHLTGKTNTD